MKRITFYLFVWVNLFYAVGQQPVYDPIDLYREDSTGIFQSEGAYDSENNRTGNWVEYQPFLTEIFDVDVTGKVPIKSIGTYVHCFKGEYVAGKREGKWEVFVIEERKTARHIKIMDQYFSDGSPTDTWVYYDLAGNKVFAIDFDSLGVQVKKDEYYLNGQIRTRAIFGANDSSFTKSLYSMSGILLEEATYVDGKLEGRLREFYENGQLKFDDFFTAGEPDRIWKSYNEEGVLIQSTSYKKGVKNGDFKIYRDNGKLEVEGAYLNDKLHGTYKYYFPNGQLWFEIRYENGQRWEIIGNYDMEGNVKEKGTLQDGEGTVYYYHQDGRLREIITYKKGKVVEIEKID